MDEVASEASGASETLARHRRSSVSAIDGGAAARRASNRRAGRSLWRARSAPRVHVPRTVPDRSTRSPSPSDPQPGCVVCVIDDRVCVLFLFLLFFMLYNSTTSLHVLQPRGIKYHSREPMARGRDAPLCIIYRGTGPSGARHRYTAHVTRSRVPLDHCVWDWVHILNLLHATKGRKRKGRRGARMCGRVRGRCGARADALPRRACPRARLA